MSETIPAFARRHGVSPQAIRKAITGGSRFSAGVLGRDSRGRVVFLDSAKADLDWEHRANPAMRPSWPLRAQNRPRSGFAPVVDRLTALLRETLGAVNLCVLEGAPLVVEGAAEAFRELHGRPPTTEELDALVFGCREAQVDPQWIEFVLGGLAALVDGLPADERHEMARQEGRAAVHPEERT